MALVLGLVAVGDYKNGEGIVGKGWAEDKQLLMEAGEVVKSLLLETGMMVTHVLWY